MGDERDVVLVTGFPGLGARRLVEHVLATEPDTEVVVVVLEAFLPQAAAFIDAYAEEARGRVEVLTGDVAAIDLGLSGEEYLHLARRVTRIHHLAVATFVGVDEATARYTNVGGAVEIVELGRAAARLQLIVHHSTAHVSGDRQGTVYEDELDRGQGFHSVVQETRFLAEQAMRRAMRELPVAVVRPTMLVGDSATGHTDRLDGPYLLVMLALGLPGDIPMPRLSKDRPLDIVPIDYAVRAAVAIGRHPDAKGRTFHLVSGEDLTSERVFDLIARAGGRRSSVRGVVPPQVANALLRTPGLRRLLRQPRALVQQLVSGARYDDRNTRRILAGTDLQCPPLSSYVDTWVRAVQDQAAARRGQGDGG